MRENPYFFELLSPTHLTSLPPSVAGIDEIKLCHYLIQAGGGVTGYGDMFHAQHDQSFHLVYRSGGTLLGDVRAILCDV